MTGFIDYRRFAGSLAVIAAAIGLWWGLIRLIKGVLT